MNVRGLSLVELLVSVAIVAIATATVAHSFVFGISIEERFDRALRERRETAEFERSVEALLSGAALGSFQAPVPGDRSAESVVFTTWSVALPAPLATETSAGFDDINNRFGPIGGLTEVGLATQPAGSGAGIRKGLFVREQRPPDGDLSQGGTESVLNERVEEIHWEFFDGTGWQTAWNSVEGAQKGRLPSLVRCTYSLEDDPQPKTFVVRIPLAEGAVQ